MTKRLCSIDPGYVQIAEIDVTDETAPFVMSTGLRLNASFPSVRVKARYAETLSYACDLCEMSALFSMPKTCGRASCEYDPFGNITSMEGDMEVSNPYLVFSEHHDENLGLAY